MTPEEKYKNKRYGSYAMIIIGAMIFIAGCFFVRNVILIILGLLLILIGCLYNSSVNRKYREEVNNITETPEMDFSVFDKKTDETKE